MASAPGLNPGHRTYAQQQSAAKGFGKPGPSAGHPHPRPHRNVARRAPDDPDMVRNVILGGVVHSGQGNYEAPEPCAPPGPLDQLRGRIVATQRLGEGRWRCMARAAVLPIAERPATRTLEAEFIFDHGGLELPCGLRVLMGATGVSIFSYGAYDELGPFKVRRWAKGTYPMTAPLLDETPMDRAWRAHMLAAAAERGCELEVHSGDHWTISLVTARGAAEHHKMPGESWREVAAALGCPMPVPAPEPIDPDVLARMAGDIALGSELPRAAYFYGVPCFEDPTADQPWLYEDLESRTHAIIVPSIELAELSRWRRQIQALIDDHIHDYGW